MKWLLLLFPITFFINTSSRNFSSPAPKSKWTAEINFSRQIKTTVDITDKSQCETQHRQSNDMVTINANFKSDLLFGSDYTDAVQLSSDKDAAERAKEHPLTGGGSLSNSGDGTTTNNCTCDGCGECKQTSTSAKYNGSGNLDMSRVSFSFDYDLKKKHGTLVIHTGYTK